MERKEGVTAMLFCPGRYASTLALKQYYCRQSLHYTLSYILVPKHINNSGFFDIKHDRQRQIYLRKLL